MSGHTPGPWRAVNRSSDGIEDPFLGWDIEGPPSAERGQFARGDDACLAAAAPELLDLVSLALACEVNGYTLDTEWVERAEAAIANVDGRS